VAGTLDFIVIGTQKGGTTTLWQHLRSHPQLSLPPSKEAPFFSHDTVFAKGLDWYLSEFFAGSPDSTRWGTVTPHYMLGTPDADVVEIARRIADRVPRVRLIALLRDPVDRALSHWRMSVYRGRETRDATAALRDALEPNTLREGRSRATETNSYVAQGEYGRIISAYREHVPAHRLHVAFTDDLAAHPRRTMRRMFEFLDVDADHELPEPEARHHRGGIRRRVDVTAESELKRYLEDHVWPKLSERRQERRAFDFYFKQWNIEPDVGLPRLGAELRCQLDQHFQNDAERLTKLTGLRPPWFEQPDEQRPTP
jgi:hypothetical protein